MTSTPAMQPMFQALDLEAAFPSIGRPWMFRAFAEGSAPTGYCDLIWASHQETWAILSGGSGLSFAFLIASGVLQGCVMAATAFVVAF